MKVNVTCVVTCEVRMDTQWKHIHDVPHESVFTVDELGDVCFVLGRPRTSQNVDTQVHQDLCDQVRKGNSTGKIYIYYNNR